jgi:hypothetical protein
VTSGSPASQGAAARFRGCLAKSILRFDWRLQTPLLTLQPLHTYTVCGTSRSILRSTPVATRSFGFSIDLEVHATQEEVGPDAK